MPAIASGMRAAPRARPRKDYKKGSSSTYSQDAELRARIAELEKKIQAQSGSGGAVTSAEVPPKQRFSAPPSSTVDPEDAEPDVFASKHRRKKYIKRRRKEARHLRKTELHAASQSGMVGDEDRISVPEYMCNAGYDIKFEADPCEMDLKGILPPQEYFQQISALNEALSHARAKPVDFLLLGTCTVMPFALIAWAVRHRKHRSKHKKILVDFMKRFNDSYLEKGVRMRWRRKPVSQLVIERFAIAAASAQQQQPFAATSTTATPNTQHTERTETDIDDNPQSAAPAAGAVVTSVTSVSVANSDAST